MDAQKIILHNQIFWLFKQKLPQKCRLSLPNLRDRESCVVTI